MDDSRLQPIERVPDEARLVEDSVTTDHGAPLPTYVGQSWDLAADGGEIIGQRLGPYEVKKQIGRGGMGYVFLAERFTGFQQEVAIKLARTGTESVEIMRRFRDEIQFQAALGKHPHISALLDAGWTTDGQPYFVMEYVNGIRIDQYCDEHRLQIEDRLRLFQKVCSAVQFAHQNTVIHRDLKPTNILVTSDGEPRLIDFGIAKLADQFTETEDSDATASVYRVFTPGYASPEQLEGETVTTASDVYSLGVVLYELLTGRRPYQSAAASVHELAQVLGKQSIVRPSHVINRPDTIKTSDGDTVTLTPDSVSAAPAVPPYKLRRLLQGDLDTIVLMALRVEPDRRYATAEQLSSDIGRYLSGQPVVAQTDSVTYRARKFVGRNRAAVIGAMLVAGSLVVGIISTTTQWRRADSNFRKAEAAAVRADQAKEMERLARQRAELAGQQARREADTAQAVLAFLNDILASANPSKLGRNATIRQAVDAAREDLDTALADQPKVAAMIRRTLGVVYRSLGQLDLAEQQLRLALQAQRQYEGADSLETLTTMDKLAGVLRSRDLDADLAEAASLRRLVLLERTRLLGPDHPDTLSTMGNLANVLSDQGDTAAALEMYLQSYKRLRGKLDPTHHDVLATRHNVAMCWSNLKEYDRAETELRELRQILLDLGEQATPGALQVTNLLADVLKSQGQLEESERIYRETLEGRVEVLGEGHPHTLSTMRRLTRLMVQRQEYAAAIPLLRHCLQIHEERFSRRSDGLTFGVRQKLAEALVGSGQLEEAEEVRLANYQFAREERGADYHYTQTAAEDLASLYQLMGKTDREAHFRQMLNSERDDTRCLQT